MMATIAISYVIAVGVSYESSSSAARALWESAERTADSFWMNNLAASLPFYIFILSPLLSSLVLRLVQFMFPSEPKGVPSELHARNILAQVTGVTVGVLVVSAALLINNAQGAVNELTLIGSLGFLLATTIATYVYQKEPTN